MELGITVFKIVYGRIHGQKFCILRRAVKHNFRPYIRRYTSPNETFEYGYPHSNVFLGFTLNISFVSDVKSQRWPITSDIVDDVGFPTVYRRIYCRKFLTLSYQTSRNICKCIRMSI